MRTIELLFVMATVIGVAASVVTGMLTEYWVGLLVYAVYLFELLLVLFVVHIGGRL